MKKYLYLSGFLALLSTSQTHQAATQASPAGPYGVFADLGRVAAEFGVDGYQQLRRPEGLVLENGQTAVMRLYLQSGREYQIIGTCDDNCSDLDLTLIDPGGRPLESDRAGDKLPLISSRPMMTGLHRLAVTMRECALETCFFAITVLER